jgi:hypothetical protein
MARPDWRDQVPCISEAAGVGRQAILRFYTFALRIISHHSHDFPIIIQQ